jgi:hypothetical protein
VEELEYLLAKSGFVKRRQVKNGFQNIESIIGFQLPDDYKFYLNNYEPFEGFVGEQYIVLYTAENLLELNNGSVFDGSFSNTIAIGSNGASEIIGIKSLEANNCKIVIAQYIQDIDDHIEIGTSFTDMLMRLNEGVEWFNN